MKMQVNFNNKYFLVVFVFVLIVLGSLIVFAYTNSVPNPGHGGDSVLIKTKGGIETTLQNAIDLGLLIPNVGSTGSGDGLPSGSAVELGLDGYAGSSCVIFKHFESGSNDYNSTKCAGYNGYGQLGVGDSSDRLLFKEVGGLPLNPIQIIHGRTEFIALYADGTAWGFGYGGVGNLGIGQAINAYIPKKVVNNITTLDPLTGIKKIPTRFASAYQYTCALLNDGRVRCSGYNGYGQLGTGEYNQRNSFSKDVLNLNTATDLEVGGHDAGGWTCAILADKTVRCWGYNGYGQLGNGASQTSNTPVQASNLNNVKKLELAKDDYGTSCAITEDDKVWCWGYNGYGQLGRGASASTGNDPANWVPQPVLNIDSNLPGAKKVKIIGAGSGTSICALLLDNSVACWGYNAGGRSYLGYGDRSNMSRNQPILLSGLSDVKDIEGFGWGGYNHFCALKNDGSVWCWGYNGYGQLGTSDYNDRYVPTEVTGIDGAFASRKATKLWISGYSNGGFSCALMQDNNIKCWGYNGAGHFGTGDTVSSNTPVSPQ